MQRHRDSGVTILRIDASARHSGSHSRQLGDRLIERLRDRYPQVTVVQRDLAQGVPLLTEAAIVARETPEKRRTSKQREVLQPSEELIQELKAADILTITTPIYNFSVPGALKAYIDQICRPRLTFRYTEDGPVGLVDCSAYLIITSGGTPLDSDVDFATAYLRHILTFIGISEIEVIAGDRLLVNTDERLAAAQRHIDRLALSAEKMSRCDEKTG